MKKIFLLLLATSLVANAWLMLRRPSERSEPVAEGSVPTRTTRVAAAAPSVLAEALGQLTALDTTDLLGLRDALRAAGVDESSIRGIIDGALRSRHRA